PVARKLVACGVDQLAVAWLDEAIELREAGIAAPLMVFGGVPAAAAARAAALELTAVVWDVASARALGEALPPGKRVAVHLKIDTGLSRKGAGPDELAALGAALRELPLDVEGVMSHLACAHDPTHPSLARQRASFEAALGALAAAGIKPKLRHLANSA